MYRSQQNLGEHGTKIVQLQEVVNRYFLFGENGAIVGRMSAIFGFDTITYESIY
jgi:hypothetical protein